MFGTPHMPCSLLENPLSQLPFLVCVHVCVQVCVHVEAEGNLPSNRLAASPPPLFFPVGSFETVSQVLPM